ncbi:hypothetical protein [Egicoccus halophilus]|nr:hypothetical protein [Egicoccus halophilus]
MRPTSRARRLRDWFDSGIHGIVRHRCSVCGDASSHGGRGYVLVRPRSRGQQLLRMPVDLVQALRWERTWHPVPRFYAFVGVGALVPATVLAARLPRRRLLALAGTPAAAIVGAFGWSMTTAGGPDGRRAVGMIIAPQRTRQRVEAERLALVRRGVAELPPLVPADWDGEIRLGGHGTSSGPGSDQRLVSVSVTAEHRVTGVGGRVRSLDITVDRDVARSERDILERLADLERDPDADQPPDEADEADEATLLRWLQDRDRRREHRAEQLADAWHEITVVVEGAPVTVRQAVGDDAAVAGFRHDGLEVSVEARGLSTDGLRLRRVTDVEPLIDAMLRHERAVLGGPRSDERPRRSLRRRRLGSGFSGVALTSNS